MNERLQDKFTVVLFFGCGTEAFLLHFKGYSYHENNTLWINIAQL